MSEILKENTWIISLIAILISFVSVIFVVIDRIKNWRETALIKKLKKDRVVLSSLIDLKIENYLSIEVTKEKNFKQTAYHPHYPELYNLIQRIQTPKLSDRRLALQIEELKQIKPDDLFESIDTPDGIDATVHFSKPLTNTISNVRTHLANIL